MSTQSRRHRTAEEKLQIIEEARQTEHTISEVCRRHSLAVGQFYAWEKQARQGALELSAMGSGDADAPIPRWPYGPRSSGCGWW